MGKMKELKTLNDMEHYNSWEGFKGHIEEKELKAEAVKWVKECGCRRYKTISNVCGGCFRFIQFFNLTEEDLKETEDEK